MTLSAMACCSRGSRPSAPRSSCKARPLANTVGFPSSEIDKRSTPAPRPSPGQPASPPPRPRYNPLPRTVPTAPAATPAQSHPTNPAAQAPPAPHPAPATPRLAAEDATIEHDRLAPWRQVCRPQPSRISRPSADPPPRRPRPSRSRAHRTHCRPTAAPTALPLLAEVLSRQRRPHPRPRHPAPCPTHHRVTAPPSPPGPRPAAPGPPTRCPFPDDWCILPILKRAPDLTEDCALTLNQEIKKHRAHIRSDGYAMSVGELISMYDGKEIDVRPQFQRFFRWTESQKSRLIESLLLGIPIPSIFVSQREDGVWDVIDGQQRLSTIFQFVGILRGEDGNRRDPLKLTATRYLKALDGKVWKSENSSTIGQDNQLLIKRSKIDVKIILRESSEETKYELFQRLNTGGSQLSEQEIRNVIIIMLDPRFYEWMEQLARDEHFIACTSLSDRALSQRYDLELVMRFIALGSLKDSDLRIRDLGDFLDEEAQRVAESSDFNRQEEARVFQTTFSELASKYGDDIFRRFDQTKARHLGGFLISAFEAFAISLGSHVRQRSNVSLDEPRFRQIVKDTWSDQKFLTAIGSGIPAGSRIPQGDTVRKEAHKEMPVRDQTELMNRLDRELAWRKRELTTLAFAVADANPVTALRAGICLLYAHWEGFIKLRHKVI